MVSENSISHHDLWLSEGEIVARSVDVGKSPPNPVLKVDFGNVLVDNEEHLVLTEDHILVIDVDTVDVNDDLDASRITLRVSGVLGGTLQELSSDAPPVWEDMTLVTGQAVLRVHPCGCAGGEDSLSGRRRTGLRRR